MTSKIIVEKIHMMKIKNVKKFCTLFAQISSQTLCNPIMYENHHDYNIDFYMINRFILLFISWLFNILLTLFQALLHPQRQRTQVTSGGPISRQRARHASLVIKRRNDDSRRQGHLLESAIH